MTWMTCLIPLIASLTAFEPQAGVTVVAVVKIPEVSEQYTKTKDLEAVFDKDRTAFARARDERKTKIDRAKEALQAELKPGNDAYRARRKEIAEMEAEMQAFVELEGERLEQGLAQSLRSIFDDIHAAIGEVAKERNIDIVLASDDMPNEVPTSTQQVRQQIVLQKVLYWDKRVNITDDVVTRVNGKYAAQKAGTPPAAPAAGGAGKPAQPPTNK